jgi:hypothetical protein
VTTFGRGDRRLRSGPCTSSSAFTIAASMVVFVFTRSLRDSITVFRTSLRYSKESTYEDQECGSTTQANAILRRFDSMQPHHHHITRGFWDHGPEKTSTTQPCFFSQQAVVVSCQHQDRKDALHCTHGKPTKYSFNIPPDDGNRSAQVRVGLRCHCKGGRIGTPSPARNCTRQRLHNLRPYLWKNVFAALLLFRVKV